MRCSTCNSALGEVTSTTNTDTTVKLNKYLIRPLPTSPPNMWIATLLSSLQYAAASDGARRFLLHPTSSRSKSVEVWLFSRARFTTCLAHFSAYSQEAEKSVWKGYRIFYRTPLTHNSSDSEAAEPVELPDPTFEWTIKALRQCKAALPAELRNVLAGWEGAYLAIQTTPS